MTNWRKLTPEDFAEALADAGHTLGEITTSTTDASQTVLLHLSNGREIQITIRDGLLTVKEHA